MTSQIISDSIKYSIAILFVWLCIISPYKFVHYGLVGVVWGLSILTVLYGLYVFRFGSDLFEAIVKSDDKFGLDALNVTMIVTSGISSIILSTMLYLYNFKLTGIAFIFASMVAVCVSLRLLDYRSKITTITHDMHLHHLLNRWNEGDYLYVANKVEHLDKKRAMTFFNKVIKYNGLKDGEILLKLIDD